MRKSRVLCERPSQKLAMFEIRLSENDFVNNKINPGRKVSKTIYLFYF